METDRQHPEKLYNIHNIEHATFGDSEVKAPKYIGSIPVQPEVFIGRDDDPEQIRARLFDTNNLLLLVNGTGGIGKTTLASRYYHTYQAQYAHLIWTIANPDIQAAFNNIALDLKLTFDENFSVEQRKQAIIKKLMALPEPVLLIIDNANNFDDLEVNYGLLRQCSNIHILLTTRISHLSSAALYPVGHLEPHTAIELFKFHYKDYSETESATLTEILSAMDYNTLVIELIGKNLSQINKYKKHYTLEMLKADLLQRGVLHLSKSATVATDYQSIQKAKPEKIIEAMYDISQLGEKKRCLLSIFSVLPAKTILYDHLQDLLPEIQDLEELTDQLVQTGWIEFSKMADPVSKTEQALFRTSPVIQEIVRKQNSARLVEHIQDFVNCLAHKLDYEPNTGNLIQVDYPTGVAYIQYAEKICAYLFPLKSDITILLGRLGNFHKTYGNLNQALKYFDDDMQLTKELYEANPQNVSFKNGLAISYIKLGLLEKDHSDNRATARKHFQKAKVLWEDLVTQAPSYIEFQNNLKWVLNILNELDE